MTVIGSAAPCATASDAIPNSIPNVSSKRTGVRLWSISTLSAEKDQNHAIHYKHTSVANRFWSD
jgi:hypothetical protein